MQGVPPGQPVKLHKERVHTGTDRVTLYTIQTKEHACVIPSTANMLINTLTAHSIGQYKHTSR